MLSCAQRAIAFEKLIMELCQQRWDGSYVYKASSFCAFRQKAVGRRISCVHIANIAYWKKK